jgi:hypothetical protein
MRSITLGPFKGNMSIYSIESTGVDLPRVKAAFNKEPGVHRLRCGGMYWLTDAQICGYFKLLQTPLIWSPTALFSPSPEMFGNAGKQALRFLNINALFGMHSLGTDWKMGCGKNRSGLIVE